MIEAAPPTATSKRKDLERHAIRATCRTGLEDFLDSLASRRPEDVPDKWMKDRPLNRILEKEEPVVHEDD